MPELSLDSFVNRPLLMHPVNWLVVWTVLLFGGMAYHLIRDNLGGTPPAVQEEP